MKRSHSRRVTSMTIHCHSRDRIRYCSPLSSLHPRHTHTHTHTHIHTHIHTRTHWIFCSWHNCEHSWKRTTPEIIYSTWKYTEKKTTRKTHPGVAGCTTKVYMYDFWARTQIPNTVPKKYQTSKQLHYSRRTKCTPQKITLEISACKWNLINEQKVSTPHEAEFQEISGNIRKL